MNREELRKALEALGVTQATLAALLGVAPRTVRQWLAGDAAIPTPAAILVRIMLQQGVDVVTRAAAPNLEGVS